MEYSETMIDGIFLVIEEQLKLFPEVRSLVIGISRERENLLRQYELVSAVIVRVFERFHAKKTAIQKVMIRT